MATITQQTVILDSQNQVRNADRLAREWAIAHAGAYQGQARRELGGSLPFREWKGDGLAIRIAKLTTGAYKQAQLVSVNHEPLDGAEPYAGYVVTYSAAETERPPGRLIAVTSVPDAISGAEFPWDDKAGPVGLERVIASVSADRAHASDGSDGGRPVAEIDDLLARHDAAIVLTEAGQKVDELCKLAEGHREWATVVDISASELVSIGQQLTMEELYALVRAKIALFERYVDGDGHRLVMAESDCETASAFLNDARERARSEIVNYNVFTLMEILGTIANDQDVQGSDTAMNSPAETAVVEEGEQSLVAAQQRIYTLEDHLRDAEQTISALREQLAQHETYYPQEPADHPDDTPGNSIAEDLDINRALTVLSAIGDEKRFARLRFLTNSVKLLEDYGKPRPNGVEILQALDAINLLAEAWHNTPSRNIGSWVTYFINLPGWKYAADETITTMGFTGKSARSVTKK